mgnify:CR=1 FL=1
MSINIEGITEDNLKEILKNHLLDVDEVTTKLDKWSDEHTNLTFSFSEMEFSDLYEDLLDGTMNYGVFDSLYMNLEDRDVDGETNISKIDFIKLVITNIERVYNEGYDQDPSNWSGEFYGGRDGVFTYLCNDLRNEKDSFIETLIKEDSE